MRPVARSTTAPGRPSEYWTYMLSSQSRTGNCGHAGSAVKRLRMRSTRGRGSVCGKLPTSEGAAEKRGRCMTPTPSGDVNRTATTPCAISDRDAIDQGPRIGMWKASHQRGRGGKAWTLHDANSFRGCEPHGYHALRDFGQANPIGLVTVYLPDASVRARRVYGASTTQRNPSPPDRS